MNKSPDRSSVRKQSLCNKCLRKVVSLSDNISLVFPYYDNIVLYRNLAWRIREKGLVLSLPLFRSFFLGIKS